MDIQRKMRQKVKEGSHMGMPVWEHQGITRKDGRAKYNYVIFAMMLCDPVFLFGKF